MKFRYGCSFNCVVDDKHQVGGSEYTSINYLSDDLGMFSFSCEEYLSFKHPYIGFETDLNPISRIVAVILNNEKEVVAVIINNPGIEVL